MSTTIFQMRIDETLKNEASKLYDAIGLDLPTAIRMFVKNVIANQKLPFSVERDPFYSKDNMERLESAAANAKSGKNMQYHDLIED